MKGFKVLFIVVLLFSAAAFAQDDDDDEFFDAPNVPAPKPGISIQPKETQPLVSDDHDVVFDEDEFVGFEEIKAARKRKEEEQLKAEAEALLEVEEEPVPRTYGLEAFYLAFIGVYLINYFLGKSENQKTASAWAIAVQSLYESNFSVFNDGTRFKLIKENAYQFSVTCAGRVGCHGANVAIELAKRHDIVSRIIGLFTPKSDTITIDFAVPEVCMDQFVLLICKKRDEKKLCADLPDVNKFAIASPANSLPKSFTVLAEVEELVPGVLREVGSTIAENENNFQYIQFSDRADYISDKYKRIIRFVFRIPSGSKSMDGLVALNRAAFSLLDDITLISKQIKPPARAKIDRNRAAPDQLTPKQIDEQRQELAFKRKQEQKQKENERFEKMSVEQQRKFEEKQHKKDLKERTSKQTRVVFG